LKYITIGAVWTNSGENLNGILELKDLKSLIKENDKLTIYLNKNKYKKREDQPEYNIRIKVDLPGEENE
jgi:hypothetical protein